VALFIRADEDAETTGSARERASSRVLARALATALQEDGIPVQGIYRSSRVGLGQGNLPTVLVECGYLTNADDRALLTSEEGQKKIAASLTKGLRQFSETMKGKK
jgi:N-acetylmuramoyl-L-alanine amidase